MSRRATASRFVALAIAAALAACSTPVAPRERDPGAMTAPMSSDAVRAEIARVMDETPLPSGAAWTPVFVHQTAWYGPYGGGSMIRPRPDGRPPGRGATIVPTNGGTSVQPPIGDALRSGRG